MTCQRRRIREWIARPTRRSDRRGAAAGSMRAALLCAAVCAGVGAMLCCASSARSAAQVGSGAASSSAVSAAPAQPISLPSPPSTLPPLPLSQDKVLAHIRQTLDWYRQTESLEQVPQLSVDVVERDRLRQTALTALKLAFDFGRAAATQLAAASASAAATGTALASPAAARAAPKRGAPSAASSSSTGPRTRSRAGPSTGSRTTSSAASGGTAGASAAASSGGSQAAQGSLAAASTRIASRIATLESQLHALDEQLARAPARSRAALRAERDQAAAALGLEREVQKTVQELQRFQSSMLTLQGAGAKDLLGQIADLERTVPELRQTPTAASGPLAGGGGSSSSSASGGAPPSAGAPSAPAAGNAAASSSAAAPGPATPSFQPESAGIIALVGQWFSLQSADSQLKGTQKSTDALAKDLEALRAPLIAQARTLAQANTRGVDSDNPAEFEASRRALEAAAARFRQLATLLVPIGDQDFALDTVQATLAEWRSALSARSGTVARFLLTRLAILAVLVAAVLVVSEVWRRAVFKYLHDSRRRSQFQTLRRVAVGIALAVVVLFALVSEMGSLATYVGFLTAGLAVALQNVILSVVAYFFLIGRYGVRVGDRITLSGVTGRVVDIGLVRIYLMELAGTDLHSTGRIVVLSNSVLFQPQALFKQIPGADYLWHTITLTLAPSADVQAAQQHLKEIADQVYEHYRPAIEAQHAAVRRLLDFDTAAPSPEIRVRFADHGWQFDIRYPVQPEQAARIDQRMLKAVRGALAGQQQLPLAQSGEPALRPVEP